MKTGKSTHVMITAIPTHVEENNGEELIRALAEFINNQEYCDDGLSIIFSLMMSAVMFGRSCSDFDLDDVKEGLHKTLDGCIEHTAEVGKESCIPPENSANIH